MNQSLNDDVDQCFHPLDWDGDLPHKFNYPFAYDPHPVAIKAAELLQQELTKLTKDEQYGSEIITGAIIGKMLGILIVKNNKDQLGYLSAFSGKWNNINFVPGFVGPVYDTLAEEGFYKIGEQETNILNRKVEELESSKDYISTLQQYKDAILTSTKELEAHKSLIKEAKQTRKDKRQEAEKHMSLEDLVTLNDNLDKESIHFHYQLKKLKRQWDEKLASIIEELNILQSAIDKVKVQRRAISARLQDQLHRNYNFLNAKGLSKNLLDIFNIEDSNIPPSGSGECAAPKLLQHAYRMAYKPIAMAEFWWGPSPNSEIRKHGHFYPACNGKCKPILGHMLVGLDVDDNPMLINPALGKELPVVFEDDYLIVINKPAEFLSVPGKTIHDSVYSRMRALYPHASGPLILHRLDMSTSGLMLIAKNKDVHFDIQQQFINRKVKKMYTAIVDGNLPSEGGYIELPLRVDLDDRPRQMVCYTYGKEAKTHWKRIRSKGQRHLIQFYPITGRTHQLRVHAAHPEGLNCPIIGDDIYGTKEERLHLHATTLTIHHPMTKKEMIFKSDPDFKL